MPCRTSPILVLIFLTCRTVTCRRPECQASFFHIFSRHKFLFFQYSNQHHHSTDWCIYPRLKSFPFNICIIHQHIGKRLRGVFFFRHLVSSLLGLGRPCPPLNSPLLICSQISISRTILKNVKLDIFFMFYSADPQ